MLLLVFHKVYDLIRNAQVLDLRHGISAQSTRRPRTRDVGRYIVPSHVNLWQSEEFVAVRTGLDDFFQSEVHPGVTVDEMAIECFAVLELDEHRMALGSIQEAERKLAVTVFY